MLEAESDRILFTAMHFGTAIALCERPHQKAIADPRSSHPPLIISPKKTHPNLIKPDQKIP
jgi:hypothetical protein